MRATDLLFEVDLDLDLPGRRSSQGLYRALAAAIVDGRLAAGARLPPSRAAQAFFGVSRNTAVEAYERLAAEGLVESRHGSGTYVAPRRRATRRAQPDRLAPPDPRDCAPPDPRLNPFWLRDDVAASIGFWRDASEHAPVAGGARSRTARIDFRPALVDSRLFPHEDFRRVSAKQLRRLARQAAQLKSAQGNAGNHRLREAIASHHARTRALVCDAADILVTSGAQQAFDVIARSLVSPARRVVAIEDPGYPPLRAAFAAAGARLVPIGVDDEGLIVGQLPADVAVICVTPSHQFPLGVTMSARRREALVAFARAHGAVIVEDDYDGEFRHADRPLWPLRSDDTAASVLYVGTFSKCLLPALRLGFIVAPAWAMRTLVAAKNCMDWHCATPIQLAVADFIDEGLLTTHVRRMREVYRARREVLIDGLERELAPWLRPVASSYGMHVAAVATGDVDLEAASDALRRRHVDVHSLERYFLGPPSARGLVFGFGVVDEAQIRRGLATLREVLEQSGRR